MFPGVIILLEKEKGTPQKDFLHHLMKGTKVYERFCGYKDEYSNGFS